MRGVLFGLLFGLPAAACSTYAGESRPVVADTETVASAKAPSEVRDCVVEQAARFSVAAGQYDFTLDGGFRYVAPDQSVLVKVAKANSGSNIELSRLADVALRTIVRACG